MPAHTPLSTPLSQALVAHTIELDNEFEHRFLESGGGARVASYAMWSGLLRFVGDGTTVGELVAAVGLPRSRVLSRLGGVERWRYVTVGPVGAETREGYGSARGTKDDWAVRYTPNGERAAAIWSGLPDGIEERWRARFGVAELDRLSEALRVVDDGTGVELPEYLPLLGSAHGLALEVPDGQAPASGSLPLVGLLARALMAYTLDFERSSPLSLALSDNVVRVLDREGVPVRELPAVTGVSKEAIAMSLTSLKKTQYAVVEGSPASRRTIRATPSGEELQGDQRRLHARIEKDWETRFGKRVVDGLRDSLARILEHPDLSAGLTPYPEGWRSSKAYVAQTEAVLADPRGRLPHYPMVLHRGGWPDGS